VSDTAASSQPDPRKAVHIFVTGKKGYGKTELAFHLFDSYPFDRLAIDPNADLKMPPDTLELSSPLPTRWPVEDYREKFGREHKRQTLCFRPDPSLADWRDEMDRAVGLAFAHTKTCLFVDEAHEAFPANATPPHARRANRQGRHADLTEILATPRPMTIDPLCISAADYVYVFKLPNPADRRRVAENIGWDPKDFDDAVNGLAKFEFLKYDHLADELLHFPPLPAHLIRHHKS
jgi:hypothetical protein